MRNVGDSRLQGHMGERDVRSSFGRIKGAFGGLYTPICLVLVAGCAAAPGNEPDIPDAAVPEDSLLWVRTYDRGGRDIGGSIAAAPEGWLVVGSTRPTDQRWRDILLVRLDGEGDTLWTRTWGGPGDERTGTMSVAPGVGGGWVIGGTVLVDRTVGRQILLLAVDSLGREQWSHTYGGPGRDQLESVRPTREGGYIVGGATAAVDGTETPWVIRTDGGGDTLWTRSYPGPGNGAVEAALELHNGGFILAGSTGDRSDYPIDMVVRRLDSRGDSVWTWRYGDSRTHVWPEWIAQTRHGGYLVVGALCEPCSPALPNYDSLFDVVAARLSSAGEALWVRRFGGARNDLAYFVEPTGRGTYMIGGATTPPGGAEDTPWLIEIDDAGELVWSRLLPNAFPRNGVAQVQEVVLNEFLVTGPPWLYQREGEQNVWVALLRRTWPPKRPAPP